MSRGRRWRGEGGFGYLVGLEVRPLIPECGVAPRIVRRRSVGRRLGVTSSMSWSRRRRLARPLAARSSSARFPCLAWGCRLCMCSS